MHEHGQMILGKSNNIGRGGFIIAETDLDLVKGQNLHNKDLNIIYTSVDGSLADRLFGLGVIRAETEKGFTTLLIINPGDEIDL